MTMPNGNFWKQLKTRGKEGDGEWEGRRRERERKRDRKALPSKSIWYAERKT